MFAQLSDAEMLYKVVSVATSANVPSSRRE
jgi:hypothetical protein